MFENHTSKHSNGICCSSPPGWHEIFFTRHTGTFFKLVEWMVQRTNQPFKNLGGFVAFDRPFLAHGFSRGGRVKACRVFENRSDVKNPGLSFQVGLVGSFWRVGQQMSGDWWSWFWWTYNLVNSDSNGEMIVILLKLRIYISMLVYQRLNLWSNNLDILDSRLKMSIKIQCVLTDEHPEVYISILYFCSCWRCYEHIAVVL